MDWSPIVVAVISGIGTAFGSVYGIKKSTSLVEYRLKQLEDKVEKHNQVVERTYELEKNLCILEEDVKVHTYRIKDLEGVADEFKRKAC